MRAKLEDEIEVCESTAPPSGGDELKNLQGDYKGRSLDFGDKPSLCNDSECHCIWHDHTETFCIGKTPERLDIVDGEEHQNDFQFCIITNLRGWSKHRFNSADVDLVAKAMFAGMSECNERLNLHWYLSFQQFHMDGDTIVLDKN